MLTSTNILYILHPDANFTFSTEMLKINKDRSVHKNKTLAGRSVKGQSSFEQLCVFYSIHLHTYRLHVNAYNTPDASALMLLNSTCPSAKQKALLKGWINRLFLRWRLRRVALTLCCLKNIPATSSSWLTYSRMSDTMRWTLFIPCMYDLYTSVATVLQILTKGLKNNF